MGKIYQIFLLFIFSLKLDCEKLASEKIEIQRHYVMVRSEEFELQTWCVVREYFLNKYLAQSLCTRLILDRFLERGYFCWVTVGCLMFF